MAEVQLAVSVRDALQDLPADTRERVKQKLRDAGAQPDRHLKRLSNRDDYWARIGDYRAIVDWDRQEGVLYVTEFGHRRNIYNRRSARRLGERRQTCEHCGWDGGTYSFTTTIDPSYYPGCGRPTTADGVDVIEPEPEATALTWPGEYTAKEEHG